MSNTIKIVNCPKCGALIPASSPEGLCPKCVLVDAATGVEPAPLESASEEVPSLSRVAAGFPGLEIIELVGRGGMGFVFKARQPQLDRFVALKLLPEKLAQDPLFAERFNREGRVLARLNHPNIVSVYDFGKAGDFYYLLMEFVEGVNLRQAMQAGRFSPTEALRVVPKICEALQYAHEKGILHRDIKPANILLDVQGQIKIADFGIAKLVGEDRHEVTLTATGAALGTPQYMAPEQLENPSDVDHRADIYSLGVVFYEMLTGELPIGRFAAPSSKTPVGSQVDEVVFRTLEKDRDRRYQSADQMKTEVEHLDTDAQSAASAGRRRFSRWSIGGAILVGLSLAIPLLLVVLGLAGNGGIGTGELLLALGSFCLPGLAGTLLGWRGLVEIRENSGQVCGLPLALFATLTWPLAVLIALVAGSPMLLLVSAGPESATKTIGRVLVLFLPAGVITFCIWSVSACIRWARRLPVTPHRGILKWVFLGLLVVGAGVELTSFTDLRLEQRPQKSAGQVGMPPSPGTSPQPLTANFRLGAGQAATLEILSRDNDIRLPLSNFVGYAIAPDSERARFTLTLTPAQPFTGATNRAAWRLGLVTDEGASVAGGIEVLGDLIPSLPAGYVHPIEPDSSAELMLTRPDPSTPAVRHAELILRVVSHARGNVGRPQDASTVGTGATNWAVALLGQEAAPKKRARPGEVLAHQWLKSPVGTNTTNTIRFTFTNVEVVREDGHDWLAMDYATHIRGDCEEVFRLDGKFAETRKHSLLVTPTDAPPVLRQRFQWKIPAAADRSTVSELVKAFAEALVGKSFLVPEGEQRPLLRFPVGTTDFVSVGIGARLRDALP